MVFEAIFIMVFQDISVKLMTWMLREGGVPQYMDREIPKNLGQK